MIDPRALMLAAVVGATLVAVQPCVAEADAAPLQLAQMNGPPSPEGGPGSTGGAPNVPNGPPPGGQSAPPDPLGAAVPTVVPRAPAVTPTPVPASPSVSATPLPTAPGAPR